MPFLFNQVAIFELKAHKKMQIPNFKGTFHLELDLFSSLWLSCAALIVMPHSNPQCAPLASLFLDYCSLWSAFCVLFEMDQILTWGAESCVRWILFVSQRNLLCSIPTYLGQNLAEFPPFPRQTREKRTENPAKHGAAQNNSFYYYYKLSLGVPTLYCSFRAYAFCQKTIRWNGVPKKEFLFWNQGLRGEIFNFCTPEIQSNMSADSVNKMTREWWLIF